MMSVGLYYGHTRGVVAHWSGNRLVSCTVGAVDRHPPEGAAWTLKFTPTGEGDKCLANRMAVLKSEYASGLLDAAVYLDAVDETVEKFEE